MNRRNFFSKFSLLAFFVPFIPKLKSFLYDKNLEDKSLKKFGELANINHGKLPYVYLDKYDQRLWACYMDENNYYHEEIFEPKNYKYFFVNNV